MKNALIAAAGILGAVILMFVIIISMAGRGTEDRPTESKPTSSFDSLTGSDFEKYVQRAIRGTGFTCDHVRSVQRGQGNAVVDCGIDGTYSLLHEGSNVHVTKH